MDAIISECGQYRYLLSRNKTQANPIAGPAVFIMLNPSTADATLDDPTIRRCKGFAESWDCNGIIVANLYAFRSSSPKDLWTVADPVGNENDLYLKQLALEFDEVVFAFGANAKEDRIKQVYDIFKGGKIWCLGTTKAGLPKHPLYIKADQPLIRWEPK
jgi:hypothetical protein